MVIVKDVEALKDDFIERGYWFAGNKEFPTFIRRVKEGWIVVCTSTVIHSNNSKVSNEQSAYNLADYFVSEEGEMCRLKEYECRFLERNGSMSDTFEDWRGVLEKKSVKDMSERIYVLQFLVDQKKEFAREVAYWGL